MSRKNVSDRALSDAELDQHFSDSLTTLSHLASVYDGGHTPIAFNIATEVTKIISENRRAVQCRSGRRFSSPGWEEENGNLLPYHRLIIAHVDDGLVRCMPISQAPQGIPIKEMDWKFWWNEVVYRPGAAPADSGIGMIPVRPEIAVPWKDRKAVSRMNVVTILRNKLGSHTDSSNYPTLLDELNSTRNWMQIEVDIGGNRLSTLDGSLTFAVTALPAMMRQIAFEVLVAYGRQDPYLAPLTDSGGTGFYIGNTVMVADSQ